MSVTPILVDSGYQGWAFLKRTLASQQAQFAKDPQIQRDEAYFRARIGSVKTPEDLVGDRRLLKVALTAFGLENDLDARAFVKKILADGTKSPKALANRLADKQYAKFSAAFGFADQAVPRTQSKGFADEILRAYEARSFESAVGEQDNDLRLALNAQREISALAAKSSTEDTKWYSIMGSTPLRSVMQAALGLPSSTAKLEVDQQLGLFKDRAQKLFGASDVSQFADPKKLESLLRRFLVKSQADQMQVASSSFALNSLADTVSMMRSWRA